MSFDSSINDVNSGQGINQWGASIYENETNYEGADLMRMLNGYYIGKEDTCKYCDGVNQGTCENDCTSSVTPLSDMSLNMVDNTVWNVGGQNWLEVMPVKTMYSNERGTLSGKNCTASSTYQGKPSCTDTVNRTNTWTGLVGLIYPSDYGYASTHKSCISDINGDDSTCKNNNWLRENEWYWTFTPLSVSTNAVCVWYVNPELSDRMNFAFASGGVRPSIYLSSNVQIIGGDGNTTPYKLHI